jgi:hypothetical protein
MIDIGKIRKKKGHGRSIAPRLRKPLRSAGRRVLRPKARTVARAMSTDRQGRDQNYKLRAKWHPMRIILYL